MPPNVTATTPPALGATLQHFLADWHPRQRRAAGIQAAMFEALGRLRRSRPEWAHYDLISHMLAAYHLVIENDRLTGTQPRTYLINELGTLGAYEHPNDPAEVHLAIAEAIFDLLTNAAERRTRHRDTYLVVKSDGTPDHLDQTFNLVEVVGDDSLAEPTLRATPEAINYFQNLFEFDPFDRAAAERYRSERMLHRRDYDEVSSSVQRRATSLHAVQADIERLIQRMAYNVREVGFAGDVAPRLNEAAVLIREQRVAEERMAHTLAEHMHHHAPDLLQLQRIADQLDELIRSLLRLSDLIGGVSLRYEEEQDRQLFTHRLITINPQADLLLPLMGLPPSAAIDLLELKVAQLLGPRTPRIASLRALVDRTRPQVRAQRDASGHDPFALGDARDVPDEPIIAVLERVRGVLESITAPTSMSELLAELSEALVDMAPAEREMAPWALAVTLAGAYAATDTAEQSSAEMFDRVRFVVVKPGSSLGSTDVAGDELIVIPRHYLDPSLGALA